MRTFALIATMVLFGCAVNTTTDDEGEMLRDLAAQVHEGRSKPFGCVQVIVEGGTVTCCSTDTTTCCATPNHGAECSP